MTETGLTELDRFTPAQKKLLGVLDIGGYRSISEVCEAAGVTRQTYYNALQNQDFVQELFKTATGSIYAAVPEIMEKIVDQARRGSFAHQKMLLEMVKFYQGVETQVNVQNNTFIVTRGE